MITTNLSTLKIHKLTQEQYDREREAGRLDENAIYLTPDEETDMSEYVTTEQLGIAIDDAITQAKESGDLKGEKGDDGISVTHSWNGTTLTITSASGTSSANLKGDKGDQGIQGEKGEDGLSPVRGTDYWTDADKAEIKSYVDDAILNGEW